MNLEIENLYNKIEQHLIDTNPFEHMSNLESNQIDHESLIQAINLNTKNCNSFTKTRIENEFFDMGPLKELICDEDISEILINSPKSIFYEKHGSLTKHRDYFLSDRTYNNFIERFCSENNTTLDLNKPQAQGKWRDFRFHIVAPPIAESFFNISLRRHQKKYWSLGALKDNDWANDIGFKCLKHIINSKANALIIGPTGTGKTTVLNCLLNELSENERVICIEDTSEIHLPNDVSLKLLTRTQKQDSNFINFDQSELLKECLRLRPDRIVVGEIRGKEAKDFLLALSTGHQGSFSTIHAQSASEALWRLEILTQMGAPEWSLHTIRGIINCGVDYIIELNTDHKKRSLKAIKKLTAVDGSNYLIEEVWPNQLSF